MTNRYWVYRFMCWSASKLPARLACWWLNGWPGERFVRFGLTDALRGVNRFTWDIPSGKVRRL